MVRHAKSIFSTLNCHHCGYTQYALLVSCVLDAGKCVESYFDYVPGKRLESIVAKCLSYLPGRHYPFPDDLFGARLRYSCEQA